VGLEGGNERVGVCVENRGGKRVGRQRGFRNRTREKENKERPCSPGLDSEKEKIKPDNGPEKPKIREEKSEQWLVQ